MTEPVTVVFVCWGNICRSPIAERVAQTWAEREGLNARITSAGTTTEELGNPIDRRAAAVLQRAGYRGAGHRAHQITGAEIRAADLVIAMEELHRAQMLRLAPGADIALLTDFDPDATPGAGIPDPWYGPPSGFDATLASVEAAMPGVMDAIRAVRR